MPALDTNVLVRFLLKDDVDQFEAARALFDQTTRAGQTLFVPVTVSLELEWVLRTRYGFDKAGFVSAMAAMLSTHDLCFESESALEVALVRYQESRADFSDCLHVALAGQAGELPVWTFDKAAARVVGAQRLNA